MPITPQHGEFWDRVERDLKIKQPGTWRITITLLRGGMVMILYGVSYFLFFRLLEPPKGYFFTSAEMAIHPFFWALFGVMFILAGAYLRFRAMGPIIEKLKQRGLDQLIKHYK